MNKYLPSAAINVNPDFLRVQQEQKAAEARWKDAPREEAAPAASEPVSEAPHHSGPESSPPHEQSQPPAPEEVFPPLEVENPLLPTTLDEVIRLGDADSMYFNRVWFPQTFRQESAIFHPELVDILDDPANRYVNVRIGRDGAKTTILRGFCAKRIARGISRTVLYVGLSEGKAKQSVRWIKHQIETNHQYANAFQLKPGQPFTDSVLNILRGPEEQPIWILGLGITGSVRGVNLDDYRPDLIVIDDVMDDDNSATEEQREKIINRVLGALKESLAPATENPNAKLVLLNTPQDFQDLSSEALKDPQFKSAVYGCWTKETENYHDVDAQESSWPARYPSATLRAEKKAAIARNRYSIFAREKECKLITPEDCYFQKEWVQFFGDGETTPEPPREAMTVVMAIDPVPPATPLQLKKGLKDKDYEAFSVVGRYKSQYYVLETSAHRGHNPSWTVSEFFRLAIKWRPSKILVEAVAYQATLAWILREAMKRQSRYWLMEEFKDKRKKQDRIHQGLQGPASEMAVFFRRSQTKLLSQFLHYPGKMPDENHEDELETVAVCVEALSHGYVGDVPDDYAELIEDAIPALVDYRGAP